MTQEIPKLSEDPKLGLVSATPPRLKIVLLFSGGLDSTSLLWHLTRQGHEVRALSIYYSQRHAVELAAAKSLANLAGLIDLGWKQKEPEVQDKKWVRLELGAISNLMGGSSQTDLSIPVPEGHYAAENMKQTVVPNRNMIMLSCAMAWAISLKFDAVAIAAHSGDHTIYPDCRPDFIHSMGMAGEVCDWHKLQVLAPFINLSKGEVAECGLKAGAPLFKTWSCYKGQQYHCGRCGACTERQEAFEYCKVVDRTLYEEDLTLE